MKKRKYLALLILAALLISSFAGYSVAKYVMTAKDESTVTFTAKLAEKVEIVSEDKTVIPGYDDPLATAPRVKITGKTEIPAYLYVEIVDSLDKATIDDSEVKLVQYAVTDQWNEDSTFLPEHDGTVYKYQIKLDNTNTDPNNPIPILTGDIIVSQYVKSHKSANGPGKLTFYATLVEAIN